MGEEHWEYDDVVELLMNIKGSVEPEFWEGSRFRLSSDNPEGQDEVRRDWLAIMELTNHLYDNEIHLAADKFNEFTDMQKQLFQVLVAGAMGEIECPHCAEEQERQHRNYEEPEDLLEIRAHHRRMREMSRERVYQVSEDIFEELSNSRDSLTAIRAKLEQTITLLDENDPRYVFASDLLEEVFY